MTDQTIITSFDDSTFNSNNEDITLYTVYETAPILLTKIEIEYPEMAKKIGLEGRVYLKLIIEKDGRVSFVEVVKTDNMIFNDAAVNAAKNDFFPGNVKGHSRKMHYNYSYNI